MKKLIIVLSIMLLGVSSLTFSQGAKESSNERANKSSVNNNSDIKDEVKMVSITDDNGYVTEVMANPKRVVTTDIYPLPSVLTVFLDSTESLVGIHPVSMSAAKTGLLGQLYPSYLDIDTSFMTGSDLNVEQLMLLNPDVVLYSASKPAEGDMIRNAGMKAIGVSATKWNYDVLETYRQWTGLLGKLFPNHGTEVAQEVDAYSINIKNMIDERTSTLSDADKRQVLFLFLYNDKKMITSGKSFFGQWWADAVGAKNIAEGIKIDNSNAVITMEQVYTWNPDVVFITNFTSALPEDLYTNAIGNDDWSSIKAVQNKEVYKLPLGSYRSYTPGVDTPVTLLWMAKSVYPSLFEDINIVEETRSYYKDIYGITLTDEQINTMYNSVRDASKGYVK
jgi:iron complex transport system substrate-binding protein